MKLKKRAVALATTLLATLATPVYMAGQPNQETNKAHTRYQFIDLGTFGGPASYFSNGFDGILNDHGIASGWADTSIPDPYPAFCFNLDCFVSHAFQSHNGVLTDLGTLPGGASSSAYWTSPNGLIAGSSQNGQMDPLVPGFPQYRGVIWQEGHIVDLGTLEGGHESLTSAVNSRGQVVGWFLNTVPDPFSLIPLGGSFYQVRGFLWQDGVMQDLGTLGGPDAFPFLLNERGQISGMSYIDFTPNPVTNVPTVDPFLWENGKMLDLGTLGGTLGNPAALNNRGQVVGQSNLSGDLSFHPFLWTKSHGMQDLGTLGGNTGLTNWINDAGEIVGKTDLPGPSPQNHDAVLWRNGVITDLGTLPGDSCSNAYYVNLRGQVVGTSEDQQLCKIVVGQHAFLWENGGPMVDLNTLIPPGASLQLTIAVAINDRGEIAGFGVPPGCSPPNADTCGHAFVLIPSVDDDAICQVESGASTQLISPATATQRPPSATPANQAPGVQPTGTLASLRARLQHRYHVPIPTAWPGN